MNKIAVCANAHDLWTAMSTAAKIEIKSIAWLDSRVGIEPCELPSLALTRQAGMWWGALQRFAWQGTQRTATLSTILSTSVGDAALLEACHELDIVSDMDTNASLSLAAIERARTGLFCAVCKSYVCYNRSNEPQGREKQRRTVTIGQCNLPVQLLAPTVNVNAVVATCDLRTLVALVRALELWHALLEPLPCHVLFCEALFLRVANELSVRPDNYVCQPRVQAFESSTEEVELDLKMTEAVMAELVSACSAWGCVAAGKLVSETIYAALERQHEETHNANEAMTRLEHFSARGRQIQALADDDSNQGIGCYTRERRHRSEAWCAVSDALRREIEQAAGQALAQRAVINMRTKVLIAEFMPAGFVGSATRALKVLESSGREEDKLDFERLTYKKLPRLWDGGRREQAVAFVTCWSALVHQHGSQMEEWLVSHVTWKGHSNENVFGLFGNKVKTVSALSFFTDACMDALQKGQTREGVRLPAALAALLRAPV